MFTPQQNTAIQAIAEGKSLAMRAVAGSGKTTTLTAAIGAVTVPGIALAFNKKNAEDLQAAIKKQAPESRVEAKTLNALGHRVWSDHLGRRLMVDMDKTKNIIKGKNWKLLPEQWTALMKMVSVAKARAMSPGFLNLPPPDLQEWRERFDEIDGDVELFDMLADQALLTLQESVKLAWKGEIDFDDQLYMPVMFNASFPSIPFVSVDEAQDLSALQHEMVKRLRPKQVVVVGDPAQAIYAFRGASSSSFEDLIARFSLTEYPLTVSFRCPRSVGREAARYVPDFSVREDAPEGRVDEVVEAPLSGTIICRYNAPLLKQAFRALRKQIPINYLGRDFLAGIKALHTKAPTPAALDQWLTAKLSDAKTDGARARAKDQHASLTTLHEAAKVQATTVENIIAQLMIAKVHGNVLTLATVHKAKGLEWDTVTFLNYDEDADGGQERNANYVGVTRAQSTLHLLRATRW